MDPAAGGSRPGEAGVGPAGTGADEGPVPAVEAAERGSEPGRRERGSRRRRARRSAGARLAELQRRGTQGPGEPLDLSGQNLRRADLSRLDLSFADLSGADLSQADLRGATLLRARLEGAVLHCARLDGAQLTGSDLSGANLDRVRAPEACFGRARLADASLFEAQLQGATLTQVDLTGADLHCADLAGARARESRLVRAVLDRADLSGADLEDSDVRGASFNDCDLRGARLRHLAGFDQAHWIGADLRDIDFRGAYLLRRFASDQNYVEEFKRRGGPSRALYLVWWATSDCGRSVLRWMLFTLAVALAFAGAFTLVDVDYGPHATPVSPLYFSIVTLTTLGYGDAIPVSTAAKVLALLEVFSGYFLMGGMLAILATRMARRSD